MRLLTKMCSIRIPSTLTFAMALNLLCAPSELGFSRGCTCNAHAMLLQPDTWEVIVQGSLGKRAEGQLLSFTSRESMSPLNNIPTTVTLYTSRKTPNTTDSDFHQESRLCQPRRTSTRSSCRPTTSAATSPSSYGSSTRPSLSSMSTSPSHIYALQSPANNSVFPASSTGKS